MPVSAMANECAIKIVGPKSLRCAYARVVSCFLITHVSHKENILLEPGGPGILRSISQCYYSAERKRRNKVTR